MDSLYTKLGDVIVPLFYGAREAWTTIMRQAIALNDSYFNAHRRLRQYVTNAYLPRLSEGSVSSLASDRFGRSPEGLITHPD